MVINGSELVTLSVRAKRSEDEHYVSNYAHLMLGNTSTSQNQSWANSLPSISSRVNGSPFRSNPRISPGKSSSSPVLTLVCAQTTFDTTFCAFLLNGLTTQQKKKFFTGIGYETAKALAKMKPAKLILACRNAGKAKKAASEIKAATGFQDIEPWDLDLASFASVRAFARRFDESGLQLHVLLNNAAVVMPPEFRTGDGFETTLQVNHLSTMLLTLLLLPAIRRTAASPTWAPRIILLASEMHFWMALPERTAPNLLTALNDCTAFDTGKLYGVTKLFNVLFVQELARRLARSPLPGDRSIVVSSLNPGLTNS
ncbi:hypothetical protein BC938DRAFT_479455, partial [Jimgerdemannia flammicorona]